MSERPPQRRVANRRERADATPVLVWNGLVTRMRRTGAERPDTSLALPPTVHPIDDERDAQRAPGETPTSA